MSNSGCLARCRYCCGLLKGDYAKMAEKIWWEKTVEYTYVRDLGIGDFAAPFDGNEEQMGDAVMKRENRWLLIEFKRTGHQFSSERKKYPKGRCDTYLKVSPRRVSPWKNTRRTY
jgi:hypothetical protein